MSKLWAALAGVAAVLSGASAHAATTVRTDPTLFIEEQTRQRLELNYFEFGLAPGATAQLPFYTTSEEVTVSSEGGLTAHEVSVFADYVSANSTTTRIEYGRTALGILLFGRLTAPTILVINELRLTLEPGVGFIGVDTGGGPISLTLTTTGNLFVDGFYSLAPGPVPEASTWAMMIVGLGIVGYSMRRRRVGLTRPRKTLRPAP